uniref:Uncharacterized protein n=1 Tax=Tanacetum cinerariifolium TaxID=118510 RepID=A0A6L2NZG6_TANCI|nr:hypothetical protein [Tanacetum cinerariifolium]
MGLENQKTWSPNLFAQNSPKPQSEGLCWEVMEGHGRSSGSGGEGRGNRGRGVAGLARKTGNKQCLFESWGKNRCSSEVLHN